jgi:hypothetical protein
VSIIEQAAKRLELLRRSGVEIDAKAPGSGTQPEGVLTESVPLRVAREIEERSGRHNGAGGGRTPTAAPVADVGNGQQTGPWAVLPSWSRLAQNSRRMLESG